MKTLRRLSIATLFALSLSSAVAQAPPAVPALPDTPRLTSYTIAGTTCTCAVNFALYGNANLADYQDWVEVFLNGVQVAYNDPTYGWTITSPTGALASIARPVTDAVLTFTNVQTGTVEIVGASRPARLSQWSENQGVSARNLNVAFTGIVAQLREVWDKINDVSGRDLKSQPGNTVGLLPLPAACANGWLGFDATGLIPVCRSGGTGSGNVTGPATSTVNHLAAFGNTTGSALLDFPAGTGVETALQQNIGSAGAPVLFNGAGGTPSAINLAYAQNFPLASILSYLTPTQIADVTGRTLLVDVTSAVGAGLTSVGANNAAFFPSGSYSVSGTIIPQSVQNLTGTTDANNAGSAFYAAASVPNTPIFKLTAAQAVSNIGCIGDATAGTPLQDCVYVNSTNNATVKHMFLTNAYDNVYVDGTSFYMTYEDNLNYSAYNSQFNVQTASSAGVDMIWHGNRFLGSTATQSSSIIFNGLGSLLSSDNQISTGALTGGALVSLTLPATAFGGWQSANDTFENSPVNTNPAMDIVGTAPLPWQFLRFANDNFNGGPGLGVQIKYASNPQFTGGGIAGTNALGSLYLPSGAVVSDLSAVNVAFDGLSPTAPVQASASISSVSASFIGTRWTGSAPFIDYSNLTTAQIGYLWVVTGQAGSNATPVKLPSTFTSPAFIVTPKQFFYQGAPAQFGGAVSSQTSAIGGPSSGPAAISMFDQASTGYINSVFPGNAWEPMQFGASTFKFQAGGSGDQLDYGATTAGVWTFGAPLVSVSSILSSAATAGIGYATGAGGTVTQATSKATAVTLNKASGAITLNAAALAAGTIVSFVLTDSAIAATDTLVLNHISGGTIGSYTLNAQAAAGSATINVRNATGGSLSEAIVIEFTVIKGVTS